MSLASVANVSMELYKSIFLRDILPVVVRDLDNRNEDIRAFINRPSIAEWDQCGKTPLVFAVLGSQGECSVTIVKLLLQYGANVNCKDSYGRSPLNYALQCDDDEALIRALLEAPGFSCINEVDQFNETALSLAIRNNCSVNIVKLLLHHGADISVRDRRGRSLLINALLWECDSKVIQVLLEELDCTYVNEVDAYHRIPPLLFILRTKECSYNIVKLLLQYGARVDIIDEIGLMALNTAICFQRDDAMLTLLIKYSCLKIRSLRIELIRTESLIKISDFTKSLRFGGKCSNELREMALVNLGHRSLRDFFCSDSTLYQSPTDGKREIENILDHLLNKRLDILCPIYFDVILAEVSKKIMMSKLQEVIMFKATNSFSISGLEKILLSSNCALSEMTRLLNKEELFRLILTFYISYE